MANIEETCRRSTSYSDDVNFDSVIDLEESCLRQGFQTGQAASKAKLARDGLALGLNKGWTIGEEVGHIKGLATSHLQLLLADDTILQEDSLKRNKLKRVLEKIVKAEVPLTNPKNEAEGESLESCLGDLRSRHKQSQAILATAAAVTPGRLDSAKRPTSARTLDW